MSRLEPSAGSLDPPPASDLTRTLERHVAAGFPPDLALDLVLNELVVRAADASQASAAALALLREDQMVCRASTGPQAPDLGVALDARGGLSGVCVRTREPQLSNDTEADPRVESAISRRLGIRSMLIVPVFDQAPVAAGAEPALIGILEVFSPLPNAFSESAQTLLEEFARECVRIRQAAIQLRDAPRAVESLPPAAEPPVPDGKLATPGTDLFQGSAALSADLSTPDANRSSVEASLDDSPRAIPPVPQPYEGLTLALAVIVIVAVVVVSFLIGTRIGWLRMAEPVSAIPPASSTTANSPSPAATTPGNPVPPETTATTTPPSKSASNEPATKSGTTKPASKPAKNEAAGRSDELVVYEKGKVIFRVKPAPDSSAVSRERVGLGPAAVPARGVAPGRTKAQRQGASPVSSAPETTLTTSAPAVWLAPAQAESRLLTRVEPQYPPEALAAHRSGEIVLEVHVAQDGTISAIRTLSGDPILAAAAAEAVRKWRYQPYAVQGHPAEFQTDVTLMFSLPK